MSPNHKILVVDDEPIICDVLKLNLEMRGYIAEVALSAEEALKLDLEQYDLFLLDVMMGEMNGFDLAKIIRSNKATQNTPIIFCTAKDEDDDLEDGFNAGANDYIKKPFSMKEVCLRIDNLIKHSSLTTPQVVDFKGLVVDIQLKKCYINNLEFILTKKEFEILVMLISNRNKIFSRQEILDNVWHEDVFVIDRTIDVNINRLRKKLGEYGIYIKTKLGYGYGFCE